jgi:hypothetical protein
LPSPSKPAGGNWFIGIDQSLTHFAACAIRGPEDDNEEMLVMKPKVKGARRLWELQTGLMRWLVKLDAELPVQHIAMEGYAFSRQMGHALGECGGMTKLALLDAFGVENQLAYPSIPTNNQVKMFCGLPGNAQKNLMLKAVFKKWGKDFGDDNEADAYALAKIACSLSTGARFEYEKAVLAKIKVHAEWEPLKLSPSRPAAKRMSSG